MTIQPMNISGYTAIPEEEDVTPMGRMSLGSMRKKTQKNNRIILIISISVAVVLFILYSGYYYVEYKSSNIEVYETSSLAGMKSIDVIEKKIYFGNSKCNKDSSHSASCSKRGLVSVDSSVKYQKIVGFGGAFTEASAYNFYKLSKDLQAKFMNLYFGETGLGLTLGRIHINSCDFSLKSYSFDEVDGDYDLVFFDNDVTHDNEQIIPFIKEAMELSSKFDRSIKLVASPWSPPSWMKTPVNGKHSMTGSAVPQGLSDDSRIKLTWSRYISKFISAYENKGVHIWALTPQNEPEFAAPWEACAYNASFESHFINNYLGPILRADHPELLLLGFDHNKDHLEEWTKELVGNDAKGYIDGMAFHWYGGMDRMTDGTYGYEAIKASYEFAPDKIYINTEGCSCPNVDFDNWLRAERLGHDIMFDLINYAQGWIDWNLLVDESGGPNHLNNMCDAAIIATKDYSELYLQPKYHYFGHFSKFVTPESTRISSNAVGDFGYAIVDPNIQPNIELGLFPCEKSSRQMWMYHSNDKTISLKAVDQIIFDAGADSVSSPSLCVAEGEGNRKYLRLVDCDSKDATILHAEINDSGLIVDAKSRQCITIARNSKESGALLILSKCSAANNEFQHFRIESETGEYKSTFSNESELCMTAGWPFLNAVSFVTKSDKTVTILMNESPNGIDITLNDRNSMKTVDFSIHGRSMQTLIY